MRRIYPILTHIFVFLWLYSLHSHVLAKDFLLDNPQKTTNLAPYLEYFCDSTHQLTIESIPKRLFKPLTQQNTSFGFRSDTCWLHFSLTNPYNTEQKLVAHIDYGLLDHVTLYQVTPKTITTTHIGDTEPFYQRPFPTHLFALPIQQPAHSTQDYFLQIQSINTMNVPITLTDANIFWINQIQKEWFLGVAYGISFGLLLYNLLLWLFIRERAYLFYSLYTGFSLLTFAGWHDISFQLWPNWPNFNNILQQNVIYLTVLFATLFARDYLNTSSWPKADRYPKILCIIILMIIASQLIVPIYWITRLQGLIVICGVITASVIGIARWRQGMTDAKIYVLAWLGFLILAGWVVLSAYTIVPRMSLAIEMFQMTMVLQQLLLAIGLANRINTLKQEKYIKEQQVIRAEAESAAKSDFLAKMSHEIRTPMNAVLGITQLLEKTTLDDHQQQFVRTLYNSGKTLLNVINDILDYSKINAGKLELDIIDIDLYHLIQECIDIFSIEATKKQLTLNKIIADDLPRYVYGDHTRIRQILFNLLANALKFTEQGSVSLQVNSDKILTNNQVSIKFSISDTGIGISQDQQSHLFQSFSQADSSTSRRYGGSGLGLAICKQLVELMEGNIGASSELGVGSHFWFTIPLTLNNQHITHHNTLTTTTDLSHLRILIVEDNPINQIVNTSLLQKLGITSLVVPNGIEAFALFTEQPHRFDIILMDCEMPDMDGFETTLRIREWEELKKLNPVYIIALTAHVLDYYRDKCFKVGMNDFLSKPVLLTQLRQKLSEVSEQLTKHEQA